MAVTPICSFIPTNSSEMSFNKVPFSWENEPGVSKATKQDCLNDEGRRLSSKLLPPPLPPCPTGSGRFSVHDIQIPLPPCTFQPPLRSSSTKGLRSKQQDRDPFLAAFKECTKNSRKGGGTVLAKNNYASGILKKGMLCFSCKKSCSARDDTLVSVPRKFHYRKDEDT